MKNLLFFALLAICLFTASSLFAQQKLGLRLEYGIQNVKSQNAYQIGTNNRVDYELTLVDITPAQSIG